MKHVRIKDQKVGASLRKKCEIIGTMSFNATAIDKNPVGIRASLSEFLGDLREKRRRVFIMCVMGNIGCLMKRVKENEGESVNKFFEVVALTVLVVVL